MLMVSESEGNLVTTEGGSIRLYHPRHRTPYSEAFLTGYCLTC